LAAPVAALGDRDSREAGPVRVDPHRVQRLVDLSDRVLPAERVSVGWAACWWRSCCRALLQQGTDLRCGRRQSDSPGARWSDRAAAGEAMGVFLPPATSPARSKRRADRARGGEVQGHSSYARRRGLPSRRSLQLSPFGRRPIRATTGAQAARARSCSSIARPSPSHRAGCGWERTPRGSRGCVADHESLQRRSGKNRRAHSESEGARATLRITPMSRSVRSPAGTQDSRSRRASRESPADMLAHLQGRRSRASSFSTHRRLRVRPGTARGGFQRANRVGVLDATSAMQWRMTAARPTPVKVVDAASGAPVAKGAVRAGELPGAPAPASTAATRASAGGESAA